MNLFLTVFLLFLPAAVANMAPVLTKKIPFLAMPLDAHRSFRGKRLLGDNKTVRGLLFGILFAIATAYLQVYFNIQSTLTQNISPLMIGLLLGAGTIIGDALFSFFKRQANIPPGKLWVPFDQLDWIIGSILFLSFAIPLSFSHILTAIIFFGLAHPVVNLIGFYLKIKKNKW